MAFEARATRSAWPRSILRFGVPAIGCLVLAVGIHGDTDWPYVVTGARDLGLRVYATHPDVQVGPTALALVRAAHWLVGSYGAAIGATVVAALLPLVLGIVDRLSQWRPDVPAELLSLTLVAVGWAFLASRGHVDDAIVIAAALSALWAARTQQPLVCGVLLGVATSAKPWGLIFLPTVLLLRDRRIRAAVCAVMVTAAAWLPFVIAAPGTLDAIRPALPLHPASLLGFLFGLHAPLWVRPVQFLAAVAAGIVAVRRGAWAALPLVVMAIRILTDPFIWGYYAGGLIVAALPVERTRHYRYPWLGILGFALLLTPALMRAPLSAVVADRWDAWPAVLARTALLALAVVVGLRIRNLRTKDTAAGTAVNL